MPIPAPHAPEGEAPEPCVDTLLGGSFRVVDLERTDTTVRVVFRVSRPGEGVRPSARERAVVRRLALGHCQKLVAYDFGLAHTTVSSHLRSALDKLGLERWETMVLIAAALESGGRIAPGLEEPGPTASPATLVLQCELSASLLARVTLAERAVALLVVDGRTNAEIGRARQSSPRTIANQVSSIFRKLRVHGRAELIHQLVFRGEGRLLAGAGGRDEPPASARGPRLSVVSEIADGAAPEAPRVAAVAALG